MSQDIDEKVPYPGDGFAFVLNIDTIVPDQPVEIIPKHTLARATAQQIALIKPVLERFTNTKYIPSTYEYRKVTVDNKSTFEELEASQYKYHVINFEGTNEGIYDLELISYLAESELNIGFVFVRHLPDSNYGMIWHGPKLFMSLNALSHFSGTETLIKETVQNLLNIGVLYYEYLRYDAEAKKNSRMDINIISKLRNLDSLRAMERKSELHILVLFSIIESTITHAPKPNDPYDSITRQVKTKFSLLNDRFEKPLNYVDFFGTATPDKIWGTLYSYRSAIAHGAVPDFSGELKILKNRENALKFLRLTTQRLLRQALKEPLLMKHLQAC